MANLNLRALRSVKDQAVFREKAQLQGGRSPAVTRVRQRP